MVPWNQPSQDNADMPVQGFSSQHAHRALTATHDCGTEAALSWLVENAAKLDQESDEQQHNIVSHPSEGPSTGEHLLYLVKYCGSHHAEF